jgi:late competence protein required for DNA uptake (superfamily II DNA/RNA helicase)
MPFVNQCNRCGCSLTEEKYFEFQGQILCEDCYIYESNPPKACDPLAVASALSVRKQLGQSGTEGLTERQKKIYQIIEEKAKITKEELVEALNVKPEVIESEFAVLRHCELVRAQRECGKIYLTKW